jgi:hypothetical protein
MVSLLSSRVQYCNNRETLRVVKKMVRDTWRRVAVPILTFISVNESSPRDWSVGSIADELDLEPQETLNELNRLKTDGYIRFSEYRSGGTSLRNIAIREIELFGKGAREIQQWPSNDPYATLLQILETSIDDETNDVEKGNLIKFKDAALNVGQTVTAGILMKLMTSGIH